MPVEITLLTEADIPGAIDTIQQAFADDPYKRWIFSDRSKFDLNRNRISLGIRCRWGIRNALFYVAKDPSSSNPSKVLGTAMWLPPKPLNNPETWDSYLQSWLLYFRQVGMNIYYGRGGLNLKRYTIWKQKQAALQREIWTDPRGYYFCNIVTVSPEMQGRGVGKSLFKEVTDRADREGMKCYLESSRDEPNIKIYERMGFRFCKQVECDDDGIVCKLFAMVREPQISRCKGGSEL